MAVSDSSETEFEAQFSEEEFSDYGNDDHTDFTDQIVSYV